MGNVINSCPNSSIPLRSVNLKNASISCQKCITSSFDAGKCDKICEDENNNSVLTQTRTVLTQPTGGWTCPPLTQTTSPCPNLMKCILAVVSTYKNKTYTEQLVDFSFSLNNINILFSSYILQINLVTGVEVIINIPATYSYPFKICSNPNDNVLYIYDSSSSSILKYSSPGFSVYYSGIVLYGITVTKDSLNNDVLYCCESQSSTPLISKISGNLVKETIISNLDGNVISNSFPNSITSSKDSSGNDVIYVTDYKKHNIKRIYLSGGVYTYEIIAGSKIGNNGYSNTLNNTLFSSPRGITIYNNNLYVSDGGNHCIRKIDLNTKIVTTIAGSTSRISGNINGTGVNNSLFNEPQKIIFFNNVIYVLDYYNKSIRKVVDFIYPVCSSVTGYTSVPNNPNICQCSTGYTGIFNYTDNIISGCNKIYPSQTGYTGVPGNYTCDTSKGYAGTVTYGPDSLSGCSLIPCTGTGYTGTSGSCVCISGYNGTVTYTNGVLGGCTLTNYPAQTGYTGTPGNYTCDVNRGYTGTVVYGATSLSGCTLRTYPAQTGYSGVPGNYSCDTSKGYTGTVTYGATSLSGCTARTYSLTTGYTGTPGNYSCDTSKGYTGNVIYGATSLSGCTIQSYLLTTGYTGTIGNYSCDINQGYEGTVSYNNNFYISVGNYTYGTIGNTLAWSTNGTQWTGLGSTIFTGGSLCIAYGNGICVAGGAYFTGILPANSLAWSRNGTQWTGLGSTIFTQVCGIEYGNNLWVATGFGTHTLGWSSNGTQWTGLGSTIFTNNGYCVKYGNIWVAGGVFSSIAAIKHTLAWSTNGTQWTGLGITIFQSSVRKLEYANNLWIAGGDGVNSLAFSNNGTQWTGLGATIFSTGYGIAYGGNLWVATGSGTINTLAWSADGTRWNGLGKTIFTTNGFSVKYGNNIWIAGGEGTAHTLAYSSNGTQWTGLGKNIFTYTANDLIYIPSLSGCTPKTYTLTTGYTGTAGNYSCDTINGYNGTITYSSTSLSGCSKSYLLTRGYTGTVGNYSCDINQGYEGTVSYTVNNNFYISCGKQNNTLAWSTDGTQWTGVGSTIFTTEGYTIACANGICIAGGEGTNTLAWSSNGTQWTGLGTTIFSPGAFGVAYGNNLWVAGGNGANTLAWSNNGIQWNGLGKTIFVNAVYCVKYGNIWVAGGSYTGSTTLLNSLAWSSNGTQWNGLGNAIISSFVKCLEYGNNLWVAGGRGTHTLAWSNNGTQWSGLGATIFTTQANAVAFNGNNLWIAGGSGINTLAWSSTGTRWTGLGATIFTTQANAVAFNGNNLWIAGGSGTNTLAWSSNGTQWTPLGSNIFNVQVNGSIYIPTLSGCTPKTYTLTTGYTGTAGNYSCDTINGYKGTITYTSTSLLGCSFFIYLTAPNQILYSTDATLSTTFSTSTVTFSPGAIYYNSTLKLWISMVNQTMSTSPINTFYYSNTIGVWTASRTLTFGTDTDAFQSIDSNNEFSIAITFSKNVSSTPTTGLATTYESYSIGGITRFFYTLMYYSTDGMTWNPIKTFPSRDKYCMIKGARCIKFANNQWIVGLSVLNITGGFSMLVSNISKPTQGSNFTTISCFNHSCCSIDYANYKWIAVGIHNNLVAYSFSANGLSWNTPITLSGLSISESYLAIKYGFGSTWMIGGVGTSYLVSTDNGITWSSRGSKNINDSIIGIKYINNAWYSYGGLNKIFKSTDNGITWSTISFSQNIRSLGY